MRLVAYCLIAMFTHFASGCANRKEVVNSDPRMQQVEEGSKFHGEFGALYGRGIR